MDQHAVQDIYTYDRPIYQIVRSLKVFNEGASREPIPLGAEFHLVCVFPSPFYDIYFKDAFYASAILNLTFLSP